MEKGRSIRCGARPRPLQEASLRDPGFFLPGFLSRSYNLKKKILQTQCQECDKSQCAQELFS